MRALTVVPFLILLAVCSAALWADDGVIDRAIELEKTGNGAAALALLENHLAQAPTDNEARIRYGIILSWEKRRDDARKQLELVLATSPDNYDALTALINVELWTDHPIRAEELAKRALVKHQDDPDLLLMLARAQKAQLRTADARASVKRVLAIAPERRDARNVKDDLEDQSRMWEAAVSTGQEWFNDGRARWSEVQGSVTAHTSHGSFIARFSRADRFSSTSYLGELETYLRVRPGTQVYLNGGYSYDAALYPRTRFGAELFQSLPGAFEFSAGYRRLNFNSHVNIYTGSVTKYYGNWMFVARGYFTPDSTGTSTTIRVGARRYFKDADNYMGFWYSHGASPTEIRNVSDLAVLQASSYSVEFNRVLQRRLTLKLRAGYANEERLYNANLQHYLLDLTLYYRF
jgi:YaiO family outer membrane protein